MSLVGDIILELRSRIPDAPAVHNPPIIVSAVPTFVQGGQLLGNSTHTIAATLTTLWGETTPTPPVNVTLGATDNAILATLAMSGTQVQGVNIYEAGLANFPLNQTADMWTFPPVQGQGVFLLGVGPFVHTVVPSRDTAFLPDTDGNFIGGYMAFRLLNRAISEMVKIAGGIIDVTGVQTQVNQSMYRIDTPNGQGSFYQFVNAWFDGYPMDIVQRSMMYLRNSAAGFSGILSYEQDGPSSVIQVWPQSNRTGGSTQLAMEMDDQQNFFVAYDGTGFLSIGLAQLDDEIVGYSSTTPVQFGNLNWTQFNGVVRGLGGTIPAPHHFQQLGGVVVTELNLRLSGYRMPPIYQVGQANQTLMVPQAWETPLVLHMLSQVRSMEQDDASSEKLLTDFLQSAEKIAKGSRLGKTKPRQIPIWGQTGTDARNVNGIGFGWLIN